MIEHPPQPSDDRRDRLARLREIYPDGRIPCAWCGVRPPKHNFDCPVPDVHYLLDLLSAAPEVSRVPDLHAIAKDAAERAAKNSGAPPQLLYAPILFALCEAFPSWKTFIPAAPGVSREPDATPTPCHEALNAMLEAAGVFMNERQYSDAIAVLEKSWPPSGARRPEPSALHQSTPIMGIDPMEVGTMRLTRREWEAISTALSRCLAGEPETEDEDTDAMETAMVKVQQRLPAPPVAIAPADTEQE